MRAKHVLIKFPTNDDGSEVTEEQKDETKKKAEEVLEKAKNGEDFDKLIEEYNEEEFPALLDLRCRSLGFVLSKAYWGQGLMPEAVEAVTQWLFEEVKLDAILCAHFDWNTQSARVQHKCGFRPFAQGVYETRYGTKEKEITNILYREDWEAVHR